MSAIDRILIDKRDGVATVRLSNPTRRNAVSLGMWQSLGQFASEVGNDPQIRVVLLRGDGDALFSAGADISAFEAARSDTVQTKAYDDLVEQVCRAFEAIAQPVVALVKGGCIGAGASLAASCDLIVAAPDAFFAVPAARLGLGYDPRGIARFLSVFGPHATRTLLYTAGRLSAQQAGAMGLLHLATSAEECEPEALALAQRIAANAPLTLKAAKVAIRGLLRGLDTELLSEAASLTDAANTSDDYREGRAAFLEKRTPRFTGQ